MRWLVFVPVLCAVLAFDAALAPAFAVRGHVPHLLPVLLAFVALHGARESAVWAALLAGLFVDAAQPAVGMGPDGPRAVTVLGPHVLGFAAGTWAVLELRAWLWRRNLLTLVFAAAVLAVFSSLAFVALAGLRAAYADPLPLWGGGSGAGAMGGETVDALLSAVAGVPFAWILHVSVPAWGFAGTGPRFGQAGRGARGNP